jgi:O-antigen/teichoic acid export membrane protein
MRRTFLGTARVFLAESLLIPTGLLTAAYLARRLGPEGYGLFVVSAAIVAWVEWTLAVVLNRPSVKLVAEAPDWRPIGATVASVYLIAGLAGGLVQWLLAPLIAGLLHTPALAGHLQLWAIDVPLFTLAQGHRNILVGLGGFSERAFAAAARWASRLLLILLLVELGLSVNGAILGSIGASLVELAVARAFVRPGLSLRAAAGVHRLWRFAAPLLLAGLALRLFDRLDLLAVAAITGTERAGWYGAAQGLALLPSLFTLAFSSLLLAVLSRAYRDNQLIQATRLAREATRAGLLLAPFAGVIAGASDEIVRFTFGPGFGPAASLLTLLIFAGIGLALVSITTTVLTAMGRTHLTLALTSLLPLLGVIGYPIAVPRWGAEGAASVTLASVTVAAVAGLLAVARVTTASPPAGSILRAGVLSAAAWAGAAAWHTTGWLLLLKLPVLSVGIVVALGLLGEFSAAERGAVRSALWRKVGLQSNQSNR